jgi:3-phenylpropionate/cinnamic acid dioxygenase small subunit
MTTAPESTPTVAARRPRVGTEVFVEVHDFLVDEAELLDENLHREWLGLLTDDVVYQMPARRSVYRRDGGDVDFDNCHFDDDWSSLEMRVRRSVEITSAFDRDPAPRMRRLVTNLSVRATDRAHEFAATSSILLLRNRLHLQGYDMLSARREDVVRRTDAGLRLARRLILVDQATLSAAYLNVFL